MTALTRLTLSQFRSHPRSVIETDGRPVALFGPNGAGKTNVLEAVSMLSPGRGLRRAAAEDMARRAAGIGWKVTAELSLPGNAHALATWSQGGSREVEIDGKPQPQVALARLLRVIWLTPAMDRLWTEGASERRRFLDRVTMSFLPAHAEATLAYEKAMRERNRLLKDQVRDARWYEALEAQMARAGALIAANRLSALGRLSAAQDGAETAFPRATLGLAEPDAPLPGGEPALREALAVGRARDMAAGRSLIGPHRTDLTALYAEKGVEARLCSTGEQKALLVSLVLANARALAADEGPPLLLLDEVAAHLDAARRAALHDEIAALGAQAWMTGTGPELFSTLGDRAMALRVSETDGISHLAPATL
ncbi:DNA replication/repair protein RecF [Paroceanicella profunda]|uniref:DNA replication and repair protein RecF n=1 Tax=Paroceanicella profunda TaxID=2579971 RepID=A0A5B8FVI5_9RHOB|nr:DNA replication/repair protein RecF [Paroceanicella profunda]QDL90322.1 DNA replication/repair protein RecF [Paroceanicella profunda]